MARIRSIKPAFWTDEKLAQLPPLVRMTFLGLISAMADDAGRCKGDVRLVKAAVWPLDDDVTAAVVAEHIQLLATAGRIIVYESDKAQYVQIANWKRHQRIDKPRASELPNPPESPRPCYDSSPNLPRQVGDESALEAEAEREWDRERNGSGADADDLDPVIRDHDRAAPPAPLVELPVDAHRFVEQLYSLGSPKRMLDVRRQLYDTLDPRGKGARLRKGAFVKARSPEHLAECCRSVMEDPPRNIDAAIVIVLEKLQDPPKGPTPSELHKAAEGGRIAEEDAYQRAAKSAGVQWANEHPADYEPIRLQIEAEMRDAGDGSFGRMAKESLLVQRCAVAAGFPDFDTWRAQRRESAA